jgi:preprotein translocase SecE subunit
MATAVQPTTTPFPPTSVGGGSILPGSLLGAVTFLAGVVAAGYVSTAITPTMVPYVELFRLSAFVVVVAVGTLIAGRVADLAPARGVRGGIALAVSALIATAFVVRAFEVNLAGTGFGTWVTAAVLAGCLFLIVRMLTSNTGREWAVAIEDQGWTHFHSHKRTQGLSVRRYTLIGILLVGATGAWAVYASQAGGAGDAVYPVPFTDLRLPLLPNRELVLPMVLALASLWLAWRAVNVPPFADFLIATEAEMNKVSWRSRKGLIQDTVVVLVTVVLLTLFLLLIDLFWGWLLSLVSVLPQKGDGPTVNLDKLTW